MNDATFNNARANRNQKAQIDAVQAKIATSGSKVILTVANSSGSPIVDEGALKNAMGSTAYATLIASTKTAISSALTTEEGVVDTAFAAM